VSSNNVGRGTAGWGSSASVSLQFIYSDTLFAATCYLLGFRSQDDITARLLSWDVTAETIESCSSQGQNNVHEKKVYHSQILERIKETTRRAHSPTPTTSPTTYILISSHNTLYTFLLFLLPGAPQSLTFPIHLATHPKTFLSPSRAHECQPSASTRMNILKPQGMGVSCMNFASQTAGSKRR